MRRGRPRVEERSREKELHTRKPETHLGLCEELRNSHSVGKFWAV